MVVASRLFVGMGVFGLTAGATYYAVTGNNKELAGFALLSAFFIACLFVGVMLWMASPSNKRRVPAPDTGLHGSAHPGRGAADEHGNIHVIPSTSAPWVYALATAALLFGLIYRSRPIGAFGGIGLGVVLFGVATLIWYRATVAQTRMLLHPEAHPAAPASRMVIHPPGPVNFFEQLRQALESGDVDWAADAYATDAVWYEPTNPPHEGRDAIRAYLNDFLKVHRDLRYEVQRLGVNGTNVIAEWSWSFRSGDRRISGQPGVTVLEVGPAGVVYHRDYL